MSSWWSAHARRWRAHARSRCGSGGGRPRHAHARGGGTAHCGLRRHAHARGRSTPRGGSRRRAHARMEGAARRRLRRDARRRLRGNTHARRWRSHGRRGRIHSRWWRVGTCRGRAGVPWRCIGVWRGLLVHDVVLRVHVRCVVRWVWSRVLVVRSVWCYVVVWLRGRRRLLLLLLLLCRYVIVCDVVVVCVLLMALMRGLVLCIVGVGRFDLWVVGSHRSLFWKRPWCVRYAVRSGVSREGRELGAVRVGMDESWEQFEGAFFYGLEFFRFRRLF